MLPYVMAGPGVSGVLAMVAPLWCNAPTFGGMVLSNNGEIAE